MNETLSMHGFMPHGMCYLWRPDVLWLHVGSDAIIALSYFSIPVAMAVFAQRRPDLTYRPVAWLFTAFILLCGITHAFTIWTVWTPHYFVEGVLKAFTAAASLATAIVLWPLLPKALALPSSESLTEANAALRSEVALRAEAEAALQALAGDLERRVDRRTAELERANAALRQFTAAASHDLQAPLRHIGLFAELVKSDARDLGDEAHGHIDRILQSSSRMQTLVSVLLDYAKLVNAPPRPEPVDLTVCARQAIEDRAPEIAAAGAQIELEDLPRASADPVLTERVFDNLISNALKYAGESPRIRISGTVRDGLAVVSVEDDGPGVPADHADTVFEMLKRLGPERGQSSGVGLAFCKTIVESHGGTIALDVEFEDGARFVFALPAA